MFWNHKVLSCMAKKHGNNDFSYLVQVSFCIECVVNMINSFVTPAMQYSRLSVFT